MGKWLVGAGLAATLADQDFEHVKAMLCLLRSPVLLSCGQILNRGTLYCCKC